MILNKKKILELNFEVDGSEGIMFAQRGKLSFKINNKDYDADEGEEINQIEEWKEFDEITISFQMSHDAMDHFKRNHDQASASKKYWEDQYQEAMKIAKEKYATYFGEQFKNATKQPTSEQSPIASEKQGDTQH